ncbi:MAG: peptidoglycan DD-metalloendopeptidase family protein [Bacteroidales bacterium]|nr:peptidoglycan DD-metalloendopeptidase family protein [Bacteroidales bacterium]MCF8457687.1 peptidoglycan DD-metalloendopeptidase family protein [Bacteroidales bacterium]
MGRLLKYKVSTIGSMLILMVFLCNNLSAQDKNSLEQQRKQLLQQMDLSNKMLKEMQQEKKVSLNQLNLLEKQIGYREKLILTYQTEVKILNNEINDRQSEISKLEIEIKEIKKEYADLIVSAYNNKHKYNKWMFVFSAQDFNQAYRRLKYLQQFTDYRKKQIELINQKEVEVGKEIEELSGKKTEKERLLKLERTEQANLSVEKKNISKVVSDLKSNERKLKGEIRSKEKEAKKIKSIIDKILAEEKRKREEALKKSGEVKYSLTPEEALIAENFDKNKGKFPWPTERGIVTSSYGEHAHPVLKGIKTYNNGVDISTEEGSSVRAIFKGEVRDVWAIQGKNMAVLIKHGEYFSVYQNLKNVKVRAGDKVDSKQVIGTVYTDNNDGKKTVLHVEIWKGSKSQNPESWLARK